MSFDLMRNVCMLLLLPNEINLISCPNKSLSISIKYQLYIIHWSTLTNNNNNLPKTTLKYFKNASITSRIKKNGNSVVI